VRAAAVPDSATPGYAVIVDIPVDDDVKGRWQRETGVEVTGVNAVSGSGGTGAPASVTVTGPLTWVTFLDSRDWSTGGSRTLLVTTQLSIQQIYQRIAAAQGLIGNRSFGQALLLVLLVVGPALIIEVVAHRRLDVAKSITGSVHELFAGTERVRQGDFTHKIAVTAEDQLGELAGSFNSMTASIEDLLRQAAEKKR
jgi:methyl-accepting chemotaxis protein